MTVSDEIPIGPMYLFFWLKKSVANSSAHHRYCHYVKYLYKILDEYHFDRKTDKNNRTAIEILWIAEQSTGFSVGYWLVFGWGCLTGGALMMEQMNEEK